MNNDLLHHLIELYFAGETTLEQERRLRRMLLDNQGSGDPAVEEALAVMSFTAVSRPAKKAAAHTPVMLRWMRLGSIAAALAVVVTMVFRIGGTGGDSGDLDGCVAYVGSQKIDDRDKIMELVASDWAEISAASAEISDDVTADLSTIFESTEH